MFGFKKFHRIIITDRKVDSRIMKKAVVELSDDLLDYIYDNCRRSDKLFYKNYHGLLEGMPSEILAALPKGGKPLDVMRTEPYPGLIAVINQRVADIFAEKITNEHEYDLKEIEILNAPGKYYILFIPMITIKEIIFPKSTFIGYFDGDLRRRVVQNYEEYHYVEDELMISLDEETVTLPKKYKERGIINYNGWIYFSDTIIKALRKEKISGWEVGWDALALPKLRFA